MIGDSDPLLGRPSRRAVLVAPAGLAAPILPVPSDEYAVGHCRAWLNNRAEMMRLLTRWADIEAAMIEKHGGGARSIARQASLPEGKVLRAIDTRLDTLTTEREVLGPKSPLSKATSRQGVMLKFEGLTAELFVEDFPVIYGLLKTFSAKICPIAAP